MVARSLHADSQAEADRGALSGTTRMQFNDLNRTSRGLVDVGRV